MSDVATYKQLTEALSQLGFHEQSNGSVAVYREESHDAVVVLPRQEADTLTLPQYVIAARETVFGKGIAGKQDFDQLLSGSTRVKPAVNHKITPPQSAKSMSAASHRNKSKTKTPSRAGKAGTNVVNASKKAHR